jgi:hypothetical protein
MGLFSSKTKTSVGTSVVRVIDNDGVPESVKTGLVTALFNDGEVIDYVLDQLISSVGVKAERLYRYAETEYTHGLPSGKILSSTDGDVEVKALLETLEQETVTVDYSYYAPPNSTHIGWVKLTQNYAYNPETNEIEGLSLSLGAPVYLKDMVVVVPPDADSIYEREVFDQWGVSAAGGYTPERPMNNFGLSLLTPWSKSQISAAASEIEVLINYVWMGGTAENPQLQNGTLTLTTSEFDSEAEFFQTKYKVDGKTKYFMYQKGAGIYPTLDNLFFEDELVAGSYFPFTYFRFNGRRINTASDSYRTSKKMLKIIGMDYDLLAEEINSNPDIDDVEQAMMVFGVPSVSTNNMENRYLFDYFDRQHAATVDPEAALQAASQSKFQGVRALLGESVSPSKSTVIRDNRFKMALTHSGITKRLVIGSIGSVGTYKSKYKSDPNSISAKDEQGGFFTFFNFFSKVHTYQHQISAYMYEEIKVLNLQMTYYIYNGHTKTGDETDDILLIPIDKLVSQEYSIKDREELYSRSLHFVFNSVVVTKVKWYQTGAFKTFLFVVAVVITVFNPPAGIAALGLSGAALVIVAIVYVAIVGAILQKAFKVFVDVLGVEAATALAIILLFYGGYRMISAGSISGAPWAAEMLQLSNGLTQAVLQEKFEDLLGQASELQLFIEEQTKLLDEAKALLTTTTWMSPFVIFGEKPEEFYNRTIHYGNIGTLGITAISSYVDIALTLPKLNDTLGETLNEL